MKIFKSVMLGAAFAAALATGAAAADVTIKVAYENNPGEPVDVVMHHWADLVTKASDGKVELDLYPSSQLGSKKDVIEQAMLGSNVITIADAGFLTDYDPDMGILFGPYLGKSAADVFKIYESDWFKSKEAELREKGIRIIIPNYLYGTRQLLTTKPVKTPDDLKGMKIRVPDNKMQIATFEAFGATPTPMPLADVYPALSQGIVDGVENPLAVLYGQRLQEQAKYLTMISYMHNTSLWLGGEAYFSTLDPAVVEMLEKTGHEAGLMSQKLAAESDEKLIEQMKAAGVTVSTPDIEPFKEKAMAVYKQFPQWTPGLYDTIKSQIGE